MIGDAHDQRHVVLDQDDRDAEIGDPAEQPAECVLVGAHQTGGRLVEQQHAAAAIASARAISTSRRSTCGRSPAGVASVAAIADEGKQRFGGASQSSVRAASANGCRRAGRGASAISTLSRTLSVREQLGRLIGARDAGARDLPGRAPAKILIAEPDASRCRAGRSRRSC